MLVWAAAAFVLVFGLVSFIRGAIALDESSDMYGVEVGFGVIIYGSIFGIATLSLAGVAIWLQRPSAATRKGHLLAVAVFFFIGGWTFSPDPLSLVPFSIAAGALCLLRRRLTDSRWRAVVLGGMVMTGVMFGSVLVQLMLRS